MGSCLCGKASARAHSPKSTLQDRITTEKAGPNARSRFTGRAPGHNGAGDDILVQWLQEYEDTGYPLTILDQLDAAEEFVETFPEDRRKKLQFKNGRQGNMASQLQGEAKVQAAL
ncbi:unnamed protein product [Chondrus crispus]|uniref:Uncharacterized protein n=1 Tax=Chondrus crispus TaxID=2769 RepID=R7QEN0_CHOCR|nr:unnamed protein product [Chondrus crispus]CDF36509.1 unnamed protein product [Chondrus crispus]|eukprot:XP_005716328.1 unnamed protein product [Chondrus crispus]